MKIFKNCAAALTAIIIVFAFAGCAPAQIDITDEQIRPVLEVLLAQAEELNEIYYGAGLPVNKNEEAKFYELSEDAKYKTAEDLRKATFAVFSDDLATQMYTVGVQGIYDDESEKTGIDLGLNSRYTNILGIFCMRASMSEPLFELGRAYDVSTAKIIQRGSKFLEVSISSEKDGEITEIKLTLVPAYTQKGDTDAAEAEAEPESIVGAETDARGPLEKPENWRLDSPTY